MQLCLFYIKPLMCTHMGFNSSYVTKWGFIFFVPCFQTVFKQLMEMWKIMINRLTFLQYYPVQRGMVVQERYLRRYPSQGEIYFVNPLDCYKLTRLPGWQWKIPTTIKATTVCQSVKGWKLVGKNDAFSYRKLDMSGPKYKSQRNYIKWLYFNFFVLSLNNFST